jgi:hypothetical protein
MDPRHDLFTHLRLALQRATGHRGEVKIDAPLKAGGNYNRETTDICIREDKLLRPTELAHVMVHEFGHFVTYEVFGRLGRRQSDLGIISGQARRRVLTALWPWLNLRPLSLRYYQQVSVSKRMNRGAEFPAEIAAAYLMAHVVPPYIAEEARIKVGIEHWNALPGLLWTESYGCSRPCPSGSKLVATMQREIEAFVKIDEPLKAAA